MDFRFSFDSIRVDADVEISRCSPSSLQKQRCKYCEDDGCMEGP